MGSGCVSFKIGCNGPDGDVPCQACSSVRRDKIPSDNECMICGSLIIEGLMVCSACEGSEEIY